MKILMVSMRSIHFRRWCSQLEHSGHEVHWFDIDDGGRIEELNWVLQHSGWRYKGGNFKGRMFLKRYIPFLHKLLENSKTKAFEKVLKEVNPDAVHSFVMYRGCVPIFPVMQRYSHIKWIYSSWGSDLFHFRNIPEYRSDLETILPNIDYMFTDNQRDKKIASDLGFTGIFLGVFPGGGGFKIAAYDEFYKNSEERKGILIKGYQGRSGMAIPVLKAVKDLRSILETTPIMVFGADPEVEAFIASDEFLRKKVQIPSTKKAMIRHDEVLKLMGKAAVYIGNSKSDGMPNTLLEAIIMGAFPIQSNPGGVSEEVITHGENGLLIQDPSSNREIADLISIALNDDQLRLSAMEKNQRLKDKFDFERIRKEVVNCYAQIADETLK